ncbi:MAG: GDP-mannose 4,6-dehydratase [Dehalococcoidales bacterium]|nr:GDP-mannose 4,6-dehydratase [Dehalococcoidales bacterium]
MKFLITGITGFVGPHLANFLISQDHKVVGLVRSSNGRENDVRDVVPDSNFGKLEFLYGDITDYESMARVFEEGQFEGVFHLAAQSHPPTSFVEPRQTHVANSVGTVNIAEAIRKFSPLCRLMFCSTSEVYGAVPEEKGPITEEFPLAPINPYAVSKAAADLFVRERAKSCSLPFFVTRAFSHTGPRRGRKFSISSDAYQIVRIMKRYQEPVINVGTLSSKRVVMDVRDCVEAYYLLLLKHESGEAYNVGGDNLYTMGQLLDMMLEMTGLKGKVELRVDPKLVRPIDIPVQVCDSTKCRNLTGWEPTIGMDQTLRDLLDYWTRKIG